MENKRLKKAEEIMSLLRELPAVKDCTLYGSLAEGRGDALSDIDIALDVSGVDNGRVLLRLADLLRQRGLPVFYEDYAPSLAPEKYVVSLALDETDPFLVADLQCIAQPHCTTVERGELKQKNDPVSHTFKVWTANLKHYVRGADCRGDVLRMAERCGVEWVQHKSNEKLLEEVLIWLEAEAPAALRGLTAACRAAFTRLTGPDAALKQDNVETNG